MKLQLADKSKAEAVASRALWLGWQACGGTFGMGAFQDNPAADEAKVWENAKNRADYPGAQRDAKRDLAKGEVYADYVFGRMMKLSIKWNNTEGTVEVPDEQPRRDYQSWCGKYRTCAALVEAAAKSLDAEILAPVSA